MEIAYGEPKKKFDYLENQYELNEIFICEKAQLIHISNLLQLLL